jgi:hypothetical protein
MRVDADVPLALVMAAILAGCAGCDGAAVGAFDPRPVACGTGGLVARWALEERTAGAVARDWSGCGHDGVPSDPAPIPSGELPPSPLGRTRSLAFDGKATALAVPSAAAFRPVTITVTAWARFRGVMTLAPCGDAPASGQYLVFKRTPRLGNFAGFSLHMFNEHFSFLANAADMTVKQSARSTTQVVAGVWYHVAGTYDGAQIALYVDGAQEDASPYDQPLYLGDRPVFLGRSGECGGPGEDNYDGPMDGWLDDVRIYDRALNAAEVTALYQGREP